MNLSIKFFLALILGLSIACKNPIPEAGLPPGFCATQWAAGLDAPRGLIISPFNRDILVVESEQSRVVELWDANNDGISDATERKVIADADGLNHGIAYSAPYLYASSPTIVYRWKMAAPRVALGAAEVVVRNVPCCHHTTRTLVFDSDGNLFVSSGSGSNLDKDSSHSQVRLFNLSVVPTGGIEWTAGFLWADGLRNEVALAFDPWGRLWGVENGVDDLDRPDLGPNLVKDNPAEEMNLLYRPGHFYGYPYCWSEFKLPEKTAKGPGAQWAQPETMHDGVHTDAWCKNPANVVPPMHAFPAHMAPLGIIFAFNNSFGAKYQNISLVAFHGSWDRTPPQGYRIDVVYFRDKTYPMRSERFFYHLGANENWPNSLRPVDLRLLPGPNGDQIFLTSDSSGQIILISHD